MTRRTRLVHELGPATFDQFTVQAGLIPWEGDPKRIEAVVEFRAYRDGQSVGLVQLTPDEARELGAGLGHAAIAAERMLIEDDSPPMA